MGVLKSVEPTGFLAFAPAFAGTNWADVDRRIIQNCPHGRGRVLSSPARLFGSGFAGLGSSRLTHPLWLSPRIVLNTVRRDGNRVRIGFGQNRGRPARARHFIWCAR